MQYGSLDLVTACPLNVVLQSSLKLNHSRFIYTDFEVTHYNLVCFMSVYIFNSVFNTPLLTTLALIIIVPQAEPVRFVVNSEADVNGMAGVTR